MTKFILAFLAFPFWALEDSGGDGEFDWVGMLVLIAVVSVIMGLQHLVQQLGKHRKEERHERLNPPTKTRGSRCPHCGKRKIGLADHIAAVHSGPSDGRADAKKAKLLK